MKQVIIDVREKDEFEAEHIEDSINVPLSQFNASAPSLFKSFDGKPVLIMCRSGKRAGLAHDQIRNLRLDPNNSCQVYNGGILEWKNQKKPTVTKQKGHFPIMRQVQIVAGGMVLVSAALSIFVEPKFAWIAGFVGAGLAFAGITGFCGMAELLCRMPWNKASS